MAALSAAPQVLRTSGAFACPRAGAWIPMGVVMADLQHPYQGSGLSFAGSNVVPAATPRARKTSVSGITTSSPPV